MITSYVSNLLVEDKDVPIYILFTLLSDTCRKCIGEVTFIQATLSITDIEYKLGELYDVKANLKILENSRKIRIRKEAIFLGVAKGKKVELYANSEDSEDSLAYLKPFYFSYLANSPKKELHLSELWGELEFLAETVINLTVDDFLRVYSLAYGFVCQEPIRQFQRKEVDQMKNFVNLFNKNKESFDLIIYYVTNSEKFKYAMNIGTLLLKKDEIREAMKSKRKKLSPKNYRRDDDF